MNKSSGFAHGEITNIQLKLRKTELDPWENSMKDEHFVTLGLETTTQGFDKRQSI